MGLCGLLARPAPRSSQWPGRDGSVWYLRRRCTSLCPSAPRMRLRLRGTPVGAQLLPASSEQAAAARSSMAATSTSASRSSSRLARTRPTQARPRQVCRRPERAARLLHVQQHDHVRALPRALLLARQPLRPGLPAQLALGPPLLPLHHPATALLRGLLIQGFNERGLGRVLPVHGLGGARLCAPCERGGQGAPRRPAHARVKLHGRPRSNAQVFCVPVAPRLPEPLLMPPKVWRALPWHASVQQSCPLLACAWS